MERRLLRYEAIGRAFSVDMLKSRRECPPYYCHYLAWRLGAYENDDLFQRLEELFSCAIQLPNWEVEKKSLINTAEIADFWAVLWQLQVAELLCKVGTDVCWSKPVAGKRSPDITVVIGSHRWYIECYTYRKSFDLLVFLEEVLRIIDPQINVDYDKCLPLRLPKNNERCAFVDEVLSRVVDPNLLSKARRRAKTEWPQVLYNDRNSSLRIHLEHEDIDSYCPSSNSVGSPRSYLETVLREAVDNKKNSNGLGSHRPNCLAVNYVLSRDYQLARSLRDWGAIRTPELGPHLDALAVGAVGIDECLTREKLDAVTVGSAVDVRELQSFAKLEGIAGGH